MSKDARTQSAFTNNRPQTNPSLATLMPRTQSAFTHLKHLTFALLLLGTNLTLAQCPDTVWTRLFESPGDQYIFDAISTDNMNCIVLGSADSTFLMKLNLSGDVVWVRSYGPDSYRSMAKVGDNTMIMAGANFDSQDLDGAAMKVSMTGDTVWRRSYGYETETDYFESCCSAVAGNIAVCGTTTHGDDGRNRFWVGLLNSDGVMQWDYIMEYPYPTSSEAKAVASSIDGNGLLAVGYRLTESPPPPPITIDENILAVRLSSDGDTLWTRTFGADVYEEEPTAVVAQEDGYVIVAYSDNLEQAVHRIYLIKLNDLGEVVWERYIDSSTEWRRALDATSADDGGVILGGYSRSDFPEGIFYFAARTNSTGDSIWTCRFNSPLLGGATSIVSFSNRDFLLAGSVSDLSPESSDLYIAKFSDTTTAPTNDRYIPVLDFNFSPYPNPFNNTLNISLEIPSHQQVTLTLHNLLGQQVEQIFQGRPTSPQISYTPPPTLASGIYLIQAKTPTQSHTQKVVLLK